MRTAIAFLLAILVTVPVLAGPPVNNTYKSTDIGGTMLPGRYSELYYPVRLAVNNTMNEQSWDGATLGAQWHWYCPWILSPPTLLVNTVNGSGNGQKIWRAVYTGGFCWLDGAGPWAGGDASYLATIDTWTAIITEGYTAFALTSSIRSVSSSGTLVAYGGDCMTLEISNTEMTGMTGGGALPANYPDFWDWFACTNIGNTGPGEYGDVESITFIIQGCEGVPTEKVSWGAIKKLYTE